MLALGVAAALLAVRNVVGGLWLPGVLYVPVNLALAAVLVALARRAGCSNDDLGLAPGAIRRGAAFGGALAACVAGVIAVAALVPAAHGLFEDERVAGLDGAAVAYHALVRIPLGTVVLEEVAFRGVLLALGVHALGSRPAAVALSSVLFGLWHVVPTLAALDTNDLAAGAASRTAAVAGAVAATAVGGALFCWLRTRSGSLVAPMALHTATNSCSLLAAFAVRRLG